MSCIAIIKPDHLGDLVLSSAAIRALLETYPDSHLLVASKNLQLARFLFPNAELRALDLPHLNKGKGSGSQSVDLSAYGQLVMLRSDNVINAAWLGRHNSYYVLPQDTHQLHQSVIDYSVVRTLRGAYDIDAHHFGKSAKILERKAATTPRRIGFSIGSGFHANAWALAKWLELGRHLLEQCEELVILCGPAERPTAELILIALGQPRQARVLPGDANIDGFVSAVADLDLVIATDGGTAHLCSLASPVLSVFGPSPFRRYAPFGKHNRLLTRNLACSPCCQYAGHLINTCLSNECLTGLPPRLVARVATTAYNAARATPSIRRSGSTDGIVIATGTSHIGREDVLRAYKS